MTRESNHLHMSSQHMSSNFLPQTLGQGVYNPWPPVQKFNVQQAYNLGA